MNRDCLNSQGSVFKVNEFLSSTYIELTVSLKVKNLSNCIGQFIINYRPVFFF